MLKKYLFLILVVGLIGMLSFGGSYTAPTYDSINFSLCSGYTAPTYDSINFSLKDSDACVADSCSYTSGNWIIECSDNCSISEVVNLDGGDMSFNGIGIFSMSANITNYGNLNLSSGCDIIIDDGVSLISS